MSPDDPRHGTSAGYSAHRRSGVLLCDRCRLARNTQQRLSRTSRKRRACGNCGERTEAKDGICATCKASTPHLALSGRAIELTGGRWVKRGRVLRWEAA